LRLGNGDSRHRPSLGDFREETLALLLVSEMHQRDDHGDAILSADQRDRFRNFRKLLGGDADRGHIRARPAVVLRKAKLQQSHVAKSRHEFGWEAIIAIDFIGNRGHLLRYETL
jgi:hypothetical protein